MEWHALRELLAIIAVRGLTNTGIQRDLPLAGMNRAMHPDRFVLDTPHAIDAARVIGITVGPTWLTSAIELYFKKSMNICESMCSQRNMS